MAYKMKSPYKMIVGNIKPSPPQEKNKMAKLNTSSLPKYKGGTAPMARGNMLKLGKAAKKIAKAFLSTKSQQAKVAGKGGSNTKSFIKQVKSKFSKKTNREKVTGMSEKYFKNVEKSFKNNPNLKKSSPGYYTIKK